MSSKTMTKVIAILMIVFVLATLFVGIFDATQTPATSDNQGQTGATAGTGSLTDTVLSGS